MAAVLKNPEVLQCIDLEDISFVETLLCLAPEKPPLKTGWFWKEEHVNDRSNTHPKFNSEWKPLKTGGTERPFPFGFR